MQAVASLLSRLAIVARQLPLYDVHNDTVRRSLAALLQSFATVLAREGRLELSILPHEIRWRDRTVYADPDRERSLAFHLHRDGVRGLVFHAGLDAEELAHLLRVVASAHDGAPRCEDDAVTLLWRARLRSVEVVAVDAVRPGEAPPPAAPGRPGPGRLRPQASLPEDADLPLPGEAGRERPEWLEVPAATLQALRAEAAAATRAQDGLRLLAGIEPALESPHEKMRFAEVRPLYEELRELLLTVEALPHLLQLVHRLRRLARAEVPWDPDRHAQVVEVILSCGSDEAVRRLVRSTPAADPSVRAEMVELLALACPDPLTAVTQALALEERPSARAVARQLVERYGRRYGAQLRQRFGASRGRAAADLLRSLTHLDGQATPEFLARQCGHPDPEVREEAFWHLERAAYSSSFGHGFAGALGLTQGEHRRRVLALVERSRDRRFVNSLERLLEADLSDDETAEAAAVIGALEGRQGLDRWRRWLTPGGRFFRRRLPGSVRQQIAAAAAVSKVPGTEASHLLRQALLAASPRARVWIQQLLETRGELGRMGRAS